jgi:RNA polymerase sigma-70 factor (ECF subfamily)
MEPGVVSHSLRIGTDVLLPAGSRVDGQKSTKRPLAEQTDEDLLERCKQQDHEAFAEIVDRYKNRIHWLVRRMVGAEESEDLTQEVFLRVYQAAPGFRSGSTFRTWVYKIAQNLCLSHLRKTGRRGKHVSIDEEGDEKIHWQLSDSREDLEEQIAKRDLSQRIRELVGQLPTHYRTALTLFYLNQVKYEEISEIMDIPLGTVKTYIHRGRLRLRDLLLAETDFGDLAGESSGPAEVNGR